MRGLQSTRANVAGAITTALFVLVFCLILLWRNPLVFWNDDYQLSILPVFADVARSWSEGHLPLLSPYSWVCSNLAGEFQYGTFSIFVNAAVIVIWKMFASFAHQAAALSITHLVVLAIGAFVLGRHRQFSMPLAMMVGFIAALNGWVICWGATDWFGALGAFTWLPWAWWGLEHAADDRSRWRFLWPAPFVYLVVTGGFPYTIVMLGLLATWVFFKTLFREKNIRSVVPIFIGMALGFGLSSPALLALFAYVHGSAREVQSASAHWQWLVPPTALPGLILPCWTVKWADFSSRYVPHTAAEMACGLVAPVALLTGLLADPRVLIRKLRWELLLLCTVLVIAMLPSAGVFRWSFRWLPFFHLLLAICAAEALRSFEILRGSRSVRFLRPGFIGFALVACTGLIMFIFHLGGRYALPLTWILVGLAAVWAVAEFLVIRTDLRPRSSGELHAAYRWLPATLTFIAFVATYLCIPPNCGVPRYNIPETLTKPAPLDPNRLYLSIYPPAENTYRVETKPAPVGQVVRPGSTSMWAGLRFINGYSPILASGVAREFKFAIHGEIDWDVGAYLLAQQAGPEGDLARLGVDGITVASESGFVPQSQSEWELITSTDEGRVFHRRGAPLARVRSVTSSVSRPQEQFVIATVSRIHDSRNELEAEIQVPNGAASALVSFSRPYFVGYEARIEGRKLRVESERGLFPIVEIPAGSRGRLVLSYRPKWLLYGCAFSALCAAVWLGCFVVATRNHYVADRRAPQR